MQDHKIGKFDKKHRIKSSLYVKPVTNLLSQEVYLKLLF